MIEARNIGARMGRAAGGEQDILGAELFAAADQAHRLRVLEHRAAFHERDLGALQRGRVGGLEPGDLPILVGDQRFPIEGRRRHGPAEAGGVLELVGEARGVDQELLRDAAADHAGAAEAVLLGHHDAGAVTGGDARGAHAARAASYDEQIDVVIGH